MNSTIRYVQRRITASPALAVLTGLAKAHGAGITVTVGPAPAPLHGGRHPRASCRRALADLRGWRHLLSPTGRSYRSLDRTLMNLPAGVPGDLVCLLAHI